MINKNYPTSHGEEGEREPDLSLQEYYELILRALALDDGREFDRLTSIYLVGNYGAYRKRSGKQLRITNVTKKGAKGNGRKEGGKDAK